MSMVGRTPEGGSVSVALRWRGKGKPQAVSAFRAKELHIDAVIRYPDKDESDGEEE